MAIWTNYTSKSTPADNDTLLEYDATGRALKQTPFSGVYNWLQAKIHALTASTGAWAASTDKLLTDRNGTLSRIDYSVLAKAIVEEYTGSSVAGSNQAIKTALDSLNSNTYRLTIGTPIPSGSDLNTFLTPGNYYCSNSTQAATLLHCPITNKGFAMKVEATNTNTSVLQTIFTRDTQEIIYRRSYYSGTSSFDSDWIKQPTRAEMDAVTNKHELQTHGFNTNQYIDITTTSINDFWFPVFVMWGANAAVIQLKGNTEPVIASVCGSITSLTASVITNGVRINIDQNSVRGGLILGAPSSTLSNVTITDTAKQTT